MTERVLVGGLSVAKVLHDFIVKEVLPGTGVSETGFWTRLDRIVHDLAPKNRALLDEARRAAGQDRRLASRAQGQAFRPRGLQGLPRRDRLPRARGAGLRHRHRNVDDEIARIAGPQLVVPVTNARYALNAANARWGSLYDALYGTDALPEDDGATRGGSYNPVRGAKVFAWTKRFLDEVAPLAKGSHAEVRGYAVQDGRLVVSLESVADTWLDSAARLIGLAAPAKLVELADPAQFVGYRGNPSEPRAILLATTACTSRSRSTAGTTSARPTSPESPTSAGGGGDHHRRPGGLHRRRRPRRQGGGLPQLARPHEGHAHRDLRQGRQRP